MVIDSSAIVLYAREHLLLTARCRGTIENELTTRPSASPSVTGKATIFFFVQLPAPSLSSSSFLPSFFSLFLFFSFLSYFLQLFALLRKIDRSSHSIILRVRLDYKSFWFLWRNSRIRSWSLYPITSKIDSRVPLCRSPNVFLDRAPRTGVRCNLSEFFETSSHPSSRYRLVYFRCISTALSLSPSFLSLSFFHVSAFVRNRMGLY